MSRKVWTADEVEQLTPTEQDHLFEASIVTDLDAARSALPDRVRDRIEQRMQNKSGGTPMPMPSD